MQRISLGILVERSPEDIVKYLESKGYRFSWDWHDTWQEAHAKAFTVAKAMRMDLLKDIREELERALKQGISLREFIKNLEPRLRAKGWWGRKIDPETGKSYFAGTPWRLKTIYDTNLRTAYMAGRGKALLATKKTRPYWQYLAVLDSRTRPAHRALHGKIVPADDPFWDYYYPPNGWGCRCRVRSLTKEQVKNAGIKVRELEDGQIIHERIEGKVERPKIRWTYRKVGDRIVRVPALIDPGWAYNPAKAAWQPDLDKYPYELARQYLEGAITGPDFKRFFEGKVKGAFPVAVIREELKRAIKSKTQVVYLSDETLLKQKTKHPEIDISDYFNLPRIIEDAQLIIKDGERTFVFYRVGNKIYFGAIKSTQTGTTNFLTSFRLATHDDVNRIRKKGEIIKDEIRGDS